MHNFECGQEVAEEKDEECQRQHEHLGEGVHRRGRPRVGEAGREQKGEKAEASTRSGQLSLLK